MLGFSNLLSSNALLNRGLRGKHSHPRSQRGKRGSGCSAGAGRTLNTRVLAVTAYSTDPPRPWNGCNSQFDKYQSGFLRKCFTD